MQIQSFEQLESVLDAEQIRHFKIGVFDIDGIFRGKYVNREKFMSAAKKGFGFCDVVLGWDMHDRLYEEPTVSGWHTGYRDAPVELDLSTARTLPFEPDTLLMIGGFAGDYAGVCPRGVLRRVMERAASHGLVPYAAAEYEFFLFDETPDSAREKGYRNLKHFTPGMFGYSVIRNSVHFELYHELMESMAAMDIELEGLHTETGPGVLEAAIRYARADLAGDKAALFKTFAKVLCQRGGIMATFMAKCSNQYPGQSGHIHVSLQDDAGTNVFHDANDPLGMSDTLRHFLTGQVTLMPELLAMVCSTVNAYRRLVPGMWAPTHAAWGVENRTTAIRAIPGGPHATRSEYRVAPADANPYLALAVAIGSGLWGIEQAKAGKLAAIEPIEGNAYEDPGDATPLPGSLGEAAAALQASKAARDLFGDAFVDHYCVTRRAEDEQYRKWVSDWDMARYFEII